MSKTAEYRSARRYFLFLLVRPNRVPDVIEALRRRDAKTAAMLVDLLQKDSSSGNWLETPLTTGLFGTNAPPKPAVASLRIGRFQVLRTLGEGSSATVYLARDPEIDREVALKVYLSWGEGSTRARRLEREIRTLGALHHPGLPALYDVGWFELGGSRCPWVAMEYVPGETVLEFGRRLDRRGQVELIADLCDIVAFIHAQGIVHRDLKPDNILVGEDGKPRVLDFGVASAREDAAKREAQLTRTRDVVGTLAYMSPEQLTGDPNGVGPLTDVYALGVLLWELIGDEHPLALAGLPWPDAILRVRAGLVHSPLPRTVPRELKAIAETSLARLPENRYADVTALGSDLRAFLRGEPVVARRPAAAVRLGRWVLRRRRSMALLSATVLVLYGAVWAENQIAAARSGVTSLTRVLRIALDSTTLDGLLAKDGSIAKILDEGASEAAIEVYRKAGLTAQQQGNLMLAEDYFKRELVTASKLDPLSAKTLEAMFQLGNLYATYMGETTKSRDLLSYVRQNKAYGPDRVRLNAEISWSQVLRLEGQPAKAAQVLRLAIQNASSESRSVQRIRGKCLSFLARALIEDGRPEEALSVVSEALDLIRAVCNEDDGLHSLALLSLGRTQLALAQKGECDIDRAIETLLETVALREQHFEKGHAGRLTAHYWLARALHIAGRRDEARELLQNAISDSEHLGEEHVEYRAALELAKLW